jgi:hypothetical protein
VTKPLGVDGVDGYRRLVDGVYGRRSANAVYGRRREALWMGGFRAGTGSGGGRTSGTTNKITMDPATKKAGW